MCIRDRLYIEKAELQAQKIMDVANQNAKTVIESTQLRMEAAKQEIRRYEKQVADYKKRFRLFLDEQMAFVESKLDDEEVLKHQATEISQSISSLTSQMADIDNDSQNTSSHLNEIRKQSKEETEHDFKPVSDTHLDVYKRQS